MTFRDRNLWALILGGSSGIGLASAKKLAASGMNLVIVHRDRKGAMGRIEEEFQTIRNNGVELVTFNTNALTPDGRQEVLAGMADKLGSGRVRLVLHSIALGNLKLAAPLTEKKADSLARLATMLNVSEDTLRAKVDTLFNEGFDDLCPIATPPAYNPEAMLGEEDMAQTIYNMGTSLLSWVQDLHARGMFASDARVLGLTSEGNTIAWRGYAAVSAAKTALEAVARTIAVEFAPFGVRANILQPGVTDTPALNLIPGSAHMKANARMRNPFGRLTTPEDVANVVSLMAMDEAAWINGALIRIDGGEHISG